MLRVVRDGPSRLIESQGVRMTRRPAHIAMLSIPAHGHVNPSLEVIRELVARGHRVSYANDPAFAERIEDTGAALVPYRTTLPLTAESGAEGDWPSDPVEVQEYFLRDAQAMLPVLREAFDRDRPDLFLYDIAACPARVLAENWDVPVLQLSPTFVAWEGFEQDVPEMFEAIRRDGAAYTAAFTAWLAENGITGIDPLDFMGRPARSLVLIPRALQPHADRVDPERYTFVGPAIGDRSHQGSWTRPASAEKVLLVSLGSAYTDRPDFYRACLRAFGDLPGWHVVLQIGAHVDPAALGPLPANVEVHPWVPQLAVLEQADAFVTHAGMGGTTEGLYCGVPMIAVPQGADQYANADRLVELGVGRRLDPADVTPELLRTALLTLTTDPDVAARLAAIRHELRTLGGAAYTADLIEAAL
ncbi:macrolide family glycosyltransferase [Kitasatospora albolonga]|uniref:macrolide family glycosyltransferase n=1 Tax=Kitasatospora albolonga TaxID=68173 RepID=UPI0035E707AC